MHFAIERSALNSLIQKVLPATATAGSMPIFACMRVEARDGILSISGTDGRITVKAFDVCEVHEAGALGLNAKALHDIIANFPAGQLAAKMSGNRLQFKNKKAAVHISTVPEEHFPEMPNYELEYRPCHGFFEAAKKVEFATVADDTSRAWMSGVRIGDNRMAATDGHRLALIAFKHEFPVAVTVPSDLLRRAQKAVGDKVDVAVQQNRVHFRTEKVFASVSTLEGNYPDYQRIIPQTPYQDVKVDKKEIRDALDLIKATADQKELTVTMDCADGVMKLHSRSESAEGVHEIAATFEQPAKVSVSIKYLLDVVDRLTHEKEVVLEFRGELVPLVIKEEGYVNVIMPKRPA